jgi:aromatic ring-opening dioxygenase catalytic subunit (LigB family)
MPTLYIPHGGGPCFFMDWTMGPRDTWDRMALWLRSMNGLLPARPKALVVVSGHWEEPVAAVTAAAAPPLLYDYYGFPKSTYELTWPAPGAPDLAGRIQDLLAGAGIPARAEQERGFDHGVFIPLKVAYPQADVPTIQVSMLAGLDPAAHLALGRALAPLRDEGALIIGSGMSYHNMRGFGQPGSLADSQRFNDWLAQTVGQEAPVRDEALTRWATAPAARACHPREEHLLPLMVAAGAAGADRGREVFRDSVMGTYVSAVQFG